MEKRLKRVQRGAAFGYVVLKILRILLIVLGVLMVAALVFLALVNENKLDLKNVENGLLTVDFSQFGISSIPKLDSLIQDGMLTVEVKDLKLVLLLLTGVGLLVLVAVYVLLLIGGNIFKHIKTENTPFTKGNVKRLRLLGFLYILFWLGGMALSYFTGNEVIRRLNLQTNEVVVSLNLTSLAIALLIFFLANIFSLGRVQQEALQAAAPAPAPEPTPVTYQPPVYVQPEPVPVQVQPEPPAPAPVQVQPEPPAPEPVTETITELITEPVTEVIASAEEPEEVVAPDPEA